MRRTKRWFFVLALLLMLWPLYGKWADRSRFALRGVTTGQEQPTATWQGVLDGSYLSQMDDWWRNTLPGRTFLIRVRNQLRYDMMGTSTNINVEVGSQGSLYETTYISSYLGTLANLPVERAEQMAANLEALQALLREHGKELYLFISPSKARFDQNYPWYYRHVEPQQNDYDRLVQALQGSTVPCFDTVRWLQQNQGRLQAPLFYPTGIHWDYCWGNLATAAFLDEITASGRFSLAHIEVGEEPCDRVLSPNSDLYDLLNLLPRARVENYAPVLQVTPGQQKPGVFIRGSSFLDQSLRMAVEQGVFGYAAILDNINCKQYQGNELIDQSVFTEYEALDLKSMLAQSDLVILECNESDVCNLSWGTVVYLLAHPELLGD